MIMKTILLAEDEDILRLLLARFLIINGFRVTQAVDGVEALEIMSKTRIDLIMCDIMMPNMDGFELLKRIKEDCRYKDIPFVFLTARVSKAEEEYGLCLGAMAFLRKPIDINDCVKRISELIE